ncbi:hypothetical protein BESB_018450 [Besnoitia besnoiti]|uniref:Uncharacterized protein n=1 Tax=Besnoitia besnoiti TaxID=94643 RepID=A0A2A9MA86_BESBE|nr:hypothetical protein BESB_018450 [Besnoitia besnoiti]PFH32527.1 hypothetical protein BESB_018450 [Besnoitia besnoiti]
MVACGPAASLKNTATHVIDVPLSASHRQIHEAFFDAFLTPQQLSAYIRNAVAKALDLLPHRVQVWPLAGSLHTVRTGCGIAQLRLLGPDLDSEKTRDEQSSHQALGESFAKQLFDPLSFLNTDIFANLQTTGVPFKLAHRLLEAPGVVETVDLLELNARARQLSGKWPRFLPQVTVEDTDDLLAVFGSRLTAVSTVVELRQMAHEASNSEDSTHWETVDALVASAVDEVLRTSRSQECSTSATISSATPQNGFANRSIEWRLCYSAGVHNLSDILKNTVAKREQLTDEIGRKIRLWTRNTPESELVVRQEVEMVSPLLDLIDGLLHTVTVQGVALTQPQPKSVHNFLFPFVVAHHLNSITARRDQRSFVCTPVRLADPLGLVQVFRCGDTEKGFLQFPLAMPQQIDSALLEKAICSWVRREFETSECSVAVHPGMRFRPGRFSPFEGVECSWIQLSGVGLPELQEAYNRNTSAILTDMGASVSAALSPAISSARVLVSKVIPVSQARGEVPAVSFRVMILPDLSCREDSAAEAMDRLRMEDAVHQVLFDEYVLKRLMPRLETVGAFEAHLMANNVKLLHSQPLPVAEDLDLVKEDLILWQVTMEDIMTAYGTIGHFSQYITSTLATAFRVSHARFVVVRIWTKPHPLRFRRPWESLLPGRSVTVVRIAIRSPDETTDITERLYHPRFLQLLLEQQLRQRNKNNGMRRFLVDGLKHLLNRNHVRVSARCAFTHLVH